MVEVSAGWKHTCGVTTNRTAYCWGDNTWGTLGDGSTAERRVPVAVVGGLSWVAIAAGDGHTCALSTGRELYCWGRNNTGQLGDGSLINHLWPKRVGEP
jgi:alpha-tubulin suppressor-like RCC1 family protein